MEYFEKLEKNPYEDLRWNIPERKQGTVNIIGGNAQRFRDEVKIAEFLEREYPVEMARLVLPEALRGKLPELPNISFLPATESGGFGESQELIDVFRMGDFNLILGDLSRNSVTGKAVASACISSEKMTLVTRDAIDLLAENRPERWLMNENLILMGSVMQLMKLLRAVYYPKMLLASQSLVQVSEVLHKFTLSYPLAIVTLHNGQILVTKDGTVKAVELAKSGYMPIMFWSGELVAKIVAMNLFNPSQFIPATVCGIWG